ncbi:MAG: hypothetical protein L6R39_002757 [Caloplaca ligustica]|nr:MAG: hypothetical protein L6R39_002757 [Caloplaca ligustica]
MASDHVFRISRTDSPGDYILLNTSPNGSSPLDLRLLATEGTEPYVKHLKHTRIAKYRAKTNHLTEPQWEDLLRSTLLQERPPNQQAIKQEDATDSEEAPTKDLELVASLSDTKLTITIRKSISGIHQKLGDLVLSKDPSADINLFDWTTTAVARAEALQTEAANLQRELAAQTQTAQRRNEQLEELIQAKKEHEDALLQKCAILINEKKKKIRQQQRLLETAKVSTKRLKEVQQGRTHQANAPPRRRPEPSRAGKRKATAPLSDDEDGGFENVRVKAEERQDEEQPDSEDQVTPQHSDLDETEDEADGGSDLDSAVPAPQTAKGKVMEEVEVDVEGQEGGGLRDDDDMEIPPKRDLPFRQDDVGKKVEDKGQDTHIADDDETDDDEL